jgi:hypothetical protein
VSFVAGIAALHGIHAEHSWAQWPGLIADIAWCGYMVRIAASHLNHSGF